MNAIALFNSLMETLANEVSRYESHGTTDNVRSSISNTSSDDVRSYASNRLLAGLRKKFRSVSDVHCRDKQALRANAAVDLFLSMNAHADSMNQVISSGRLPARAKIVLAEARECLDQAITRGDCTWTLPLAEIMHSLRPGPGSSVGALGCDFQTKMFESPLSYTSDGVYRLYKSFVDQNPLWCEAEAIRLQSHGQGDRVAIGTLVTVPKTDAIDRVIMVEPTVNTCLQLGTEAYLRKILRRAFHFDLATQPDVNRELARLGSLERGDQRGEVWCTVDLKSASDTISLELAKALLPRELYEWLLLISCRQCKLPDGSVVELHMMSTMGNGCTFPLQTLLFGSLLQACYRVCGKLHRSYSEKLKYNFSVFGDDLVITREMYSFVVEVLGELGFFVNSDKSFSSGGFRESCGTDWYYGHDVRPVFCESLDSPQDIISLINRLNRWSALHSVPLPKTISTLICAISPKQRFVVPNYESDDAGIHVPLAIIEDLDADSFPAVRSIAVNKQVSKSFGAPGGILYRVFNPKTARKRFWVTRGRRRDGTLEYIEVPGTNIPGLLISILHGSITGTYTSIRMKRVYYKADLACTPGWGEPGRFGGRVYHWSHSYEHWTSLIRVNLSSFC